MKPLVFDTFCYNGDLVLPLRLEKLYNVVDYFILIESRLLWSGIDKKKFYIDDVYPSLWMYADKLIVIKINPEDYTPVPPSFSYQTNDTNREAWWREHSARNYCRSTIDSIAGDHPYIISCGDVDEIPCPDLLSENSIWESYVKAQKPIFLDMHYYNYNFKWQKKKDWRKAFFANDKVKDPLSDIRIYGDPFHFLPYAGWHCSWFMNRRQMVEKFEGGSHTEYNRAELKTSENIDGSLRYGYDLLRRGDQEDCIPSHVCCKYGKYDNCNDFVKFQKMLELVQG